MHCERHTAQFKKNVYRDIKKLSKILLCGWTETRSNTELNLVKFILCPFIIKFISHKLHWLSQENQ
jgi:hypothetical protein